MGEKNEYWLFDACVVVLTLGAFLLMLSYAATNMVNSALCEITLQGAALNPERFSYNSSGLIYQEGTGNFIPKFSVNGSVSIKAPCSYLIQVIK